MTPEERGFWTEIVLGLPAGAAAFSAMPYSLIVLPAALVCFFLAWKIKKDLL